MESLDEAFALRHPEWKPRLEKLYKAVKSYKPPKGAWFCRTCNTITANGPRCKQHGGKLSTEIRERELVGWARLISEAA